MALLGGKIGELFCSVHVRKGYVGHKFCTDAFELIF